MLPLVPPYLTFIAGAGLEELVEGGERRARRDTLVAAMLFVLGFSTVFVLLGATASALGQTVRAYLPVLTTLAGSPSSAWACTFSACSGSACSIGKSG